MIQLLREHKNILKPIGIAILVGLALWAIFLLVTRPSQQTENVINLDLPENKLVEFPKDDARHIAMTELWYYNGHLKDKQSNEYSYHYSVYLHDALARHTIVHASLHDHKNNKTYQYQRRLGGTSFIPTKEGFSFDWKVWKMQGANGKDTISGATTEFKFNLDLQTTSPEIAHGKTGLLDLDSAGEGYYYSRPRMQTKGNLTINDKKIKVTGESWFDHQWGDYRATVLSWKWFALQLDNGSNLMLYLLANSDGKTILQTATLSKGRDAKYFTQKDFKTTPTDYWSSEISEHKYPVAWNITIPSEKIDITLKPKNKNSEFDSRATTYNTYWEGPVSVSGSNKGKGFLEVSITNQKDRTAKTQPVK